MFLIRSKLSITVYLYLVLYRSTSLQSLLFLKLIETFLWKQNLMNNCSNPSKQQPCNHDSFSKISGAFIALQSRLFLKNIENFLCKQKLVNDHSIPSKHAEKQLPFVLINTCLLPNPLLALTDGQNDGQRNEDTCCAWAGGTFFQLCCCVSFWFWWEIGFGCTYLCTQSTIQLWCCVSFLVLTGNIFWCYVCTQCTIQLCDCVSFLVVAGNSSQNESMFLQKNLTGLLYYDPLANVCISQDLTLFYSVSFYFEYFSCTTQINKTKFKSEYYLRINIGDQVKMRTLAITL